MAEPAAFNWPDRRLIDLLGIEVPILLAPMAGPVGAPAAIAVAKAGGLGSLPCALISPDEVRAGIAEFRAGTDGPLNLNFFCHTPPEPDPEAARRWQARLAPYYRELGLDPSAPVPVSNRAPFDDTLCRLVEELRPEVVSFHFGLPEPRLLERVKAAGAKVLSSATTAAEAVWLEAHGADAVIAQGAEAGGHRGHFLDMDVSRQAGLFALLPQVVDAVRLPVIAAGGIADGRGIAAAFMLGAGAAQIGTAFLFCPELKVSPLHRRALAEARDDSTAVTNLFTGRPARGIVNRLMAENGPLNPEAPAFPLAGGALAPLKAAAEARDSTDFTSLWSGQAARLAAPIAMGRSAGALVTRLAKDAAARLASAAG